MHLISQFFSLIFTLVTFLDEAFDLRSPTFYAMQAIGHPTVEACTSTATCGPFTIWWDNTVKKYNDPTAQQQTYYPFIKLIVVATDFTFLLTLFSIPIAANLVQYIIKFYGVIDKQKSEFWASQAQ